MGNGQINAFFSVDKHLEVRGVYKLNEGLTHLSTSSCLFAFIFFKKKEYCFCNLVTITTPAQFVID